MRALIVAILLGALTLFPSSGNTAARPRQNAVSDSEKIAVDI